MSYHLDPDLQRRLRELSEPGEPVYRPARLPAGFWLLVLVTVGLIAFALGIMLHPKAGNAADFGGFDSCRILSDDHPCMWHNPYSYEDPMILPMPPLHYREYIEI